jgi:hypothetical protein
MGPFLVELRAVFSWNGRDTAVGAGDLASDEFPVQDKAMVVCPDCDTIWQPKDLVPPGQEG